MARTKTPPKKNVRKPVKAPKKVAMPIPQKGIYLHYPDKKVALLVEGIDCKRFETMPLEFSYDIPSVKITYEGYSELIVGIPFSVITPD